MAVVVVVDFVVVCGFVAVVVVVARLAARSGAAVDGVATGAGGMVGRG